MAIPAIVGFFLLTITFLQIMKKNLNIVLVHGAFGDGAHWKFVIPILANEGYTVRAVQLPLNTLADDVKRASDLVDWLDGPTLLVGHSYGGVVITGAGNNAHVVGLVLYRCICAG